MEIIPLCIAVGIGTKTVTLFFFNKSRGIPSAKHGTILPHFRIRSAFGLLAGFEMSINAPTALAAHSVVRSPPTRAEYKECMGRLSLAHDETTKFFMLHAFSDWEKEKLQNKIQTLEADIQLLSEEHRETVRSMIEYKQEVGSLRYKLRQERNKNLKLTRTISEKMEKSSPAASTTSLQIKWKKQPSPARHNSSPTPSQKSRKGGEGRVMAAIRMQVAKVFGRLVERITRL